MSFGLVGDIGGTNARFAKCNLETGELSDLKIYSGLDYETLEDCARAYLKDTASTVDHACIAIACPITSDWVQMTNHTWKFSIKAMKESMGLKTLEIINDFTAVSMAIPALKASDRVQLGGGEPQVDKPIAIYGAGTGLGVAHLIHHAGKWIPLPGEGGHVDFAPHNAKEDSILAEMRKEFGHVSCERLLSGPGLVNIYNALVRADGRTPEALEPKDVTTRAIDKTDADCVNAFETFCILMGRFGGNLALNMGTFGGVYIAGGIAPRFVQEFVYSGFRKAFEDKGRFDKYLSQIPVYLVTHNCVGLLGSGTYLRQALGQSV